MCSQDDGYGEMGFGWSVTGARRGDGGGGNRKFRKSLEEKVNLGVNRSLELSTGRAGGWWERKGSEIHG